MDGVPCGERVVAFADEIDRFVDDAVVVHQRGMGFEEPALHRIEVSLGECEQLFLGG